MWSCVGIMQLSGKRRFGMKVCRTSFKVELKVINNFINKIHEVINNKHIAFESALVLQ